MEDGTGSKHSRIRELEPAPFHERGKTNHAITIPQTQILIDDWIDIPYLDDHRSQIFTDMLSNSTVALVRLERDLGTAGRMTGCKRIATLSLIVSAAKMAAEQAEPKSAVWTGLTRIYREAKTMLDIERVTTTAA